MHLLGVLATVLCLHPSAPAHAASDGAAAEERPLLADPIHGPLRAAWEEVRADLSREAWAEAAGRQQRLVSLRHDLGLPDLPAMSGVLLHAADRAADGGAVDASESLAEAAAALSPDLAAPRFEQASYVFERTPFGVASQIREVRAGFERLDEDLPAAMTAVANAVTGAIWVLVTVLILFAVAMLLRYARFASNDLRRLLPRGVTGFQAAVLLLVLLLAPLFVGLGLLLTVGVWLVVTSLYHRPTERLATLALLLAVGALPLATSTVVRSLSWPSTPEAVVHRCNAGLCTARDQDEVRRWANVNVLPYETHFTMGLVLGRLAGVGADTLEDAANYASVAHDTEVTPEALVLLGNLSYLQALEACRDREEGIPGATARAEEKVREALELWQRAVKRQPTLLPALYNAHVALIQLGEDAEGGRMLDRAMTVDTGAVVSWNNKVAQERNLVRCRSTDGGNRHVMYAGLPPERLAGITMSRDVPRDALVVPFGGLLTGRTGTPGTGVVGLVGAGLVLLLWLLRRLLRPARACVKCAGVADPRTRLEIAEGAICERCLLIDVRRAFIDAKEQWFREKEREVDLRRRARRARWITWFVPGFGHLLRGAPLRGLTYLALVLGCVLGALTPHEVAHDPVSPLGITGGRLFVFGVVAGITWLVAVIDAHAGGTQP
ncbi:MAG: hypothetical protein ACQEXJ_08745 [Myxococcota bacterium]